MKNGPLIKSALIGLLLLPFLYLIHHFSPPVHKAPSGYNSTIIAFEMASNEKELEQVLKPLTSKDIEDLDKLNYVDFGFMFVYGFFIWLFISLLSTELNSPFLKKIKWLAPMAVIADIFENLQLLKLSSYLDGNLGSINSTLWFLSFFTWLKWGLLAVLCAIIGVQLVKLTWKSKIIGGLLILPMILLILAIVTHHPVHEDLFATSIFFGFFLIFSYALFYKKADLA